MESRNCVIFISKFSSSASQQKRNTIEKISYTWPHFLYTLKWQDTQLHPFNSKFTPIHACLKRYQYKSTKNSFKTLFAWYKIKWKANKVLIRRRKKTLRKKYKILLLIWELSRSSVIASWLLFLFLNYYIFLSRKTFTNWRDR